jgi:hypothetical protein
MQTLHRLAEAVLLLLIAAGESFADLAAEEEQTEAGAHAPSNKGCLLSAVAVAVDIDVAVAVAVVDSCLSLLRCANGAVALFNTTPHHTTRHNVPHSAVCCKSGRVTTDGAWKTRGRFPSGDRSLTWGCCCGAVCGILLRALLLYAVVSSS